MSGYITTQTWASAHPAAAKAFQTALEKGNAYANANPSVVREVLPTYTSISATAAASCAARHVPWERLPRPCCSAS